MTLWNKLQGGLRLTRDKELDCEQFAEQLAAYVDHGLDGDEAVRLMDHHLEICPECAEQLALLKTALEA